LLLCLLLLSTLSFLFSFIPPPPAHTYTLSLHDALPIYLNETSGLSTGGATPVGADHLSSSVRPVVPHVASLAGFARRDRCGRHGWVRGLQDRHHRGAAGRRHGYGSLPRHPVGRGRSR